MLLPSQYKAVTSDTDQSYQGDFSIYLVRAYKMFRIKKISSSVLLDASQFFCRRQISKYSTGERFSNFPHKSSRKPVPVDNPLKRTSQSPRQAVSATQEWLWIVGDDNLVIPRLIALSLVECQGGFRPPNPRIRGDPPERTAETKRLAEVTLRAPLAPLAEYISAEMVESLEKSPYYVDSEKAIVLRCHKFLKPGDNKKRCFKEVTRLVMNVAKEIVYREKIAASVEMADEEEENVNDLQ